MPQAVKKSNEVKPPAPTEAKCATNASSIVESAGKNVSTVSPVSNLGKGDATVTPSESSTHAPATPKRDQTEHAEVASKADTNSNVYKAGNWDDDIATSSDASDTPVQLLESSSRSTEVCAPLPDNKDETDDAEKVCKAATDSCASKTNNLDEHVTTLVTSNMVTDGDTHEPYTKTKVLSDLNVDDVTAWLQSMRLDKAFGDEFVEQLIDGECLAAAEEEDLERSGK